MSQGDSSQLDTEKRLLLALVLSTIILLFSPYLLHWFSPPAELPPSPAVEERTSIVPAPRESVEPKEEPVLEVESRGATDGVERTIELINSDIAVRVSTRGLTFQSVRLLKYFNAEHNPLELIPESHTQSGLGPLSIVLDEDGLTQEVREVVYEVEGAPSNRIEGAAELLFHFRNRNLEIERKLVVPESGHTLELETTVYQGGRKVPFSLLLGPGIGRYAGSLGADNGDVTGDFAFPLIAYWAGEGINRVEAGDLEESQVREISARWAAYDSRFFSYVLFAPGALDRLRLRTEAWELPPGSSEAPTPTIVAEVGVVPGARVSIFFGPKALEVLGQLDSTLGDLVDFGWFAVLVRPLLFCLKLAYSFVHNYGWAIIIVTFFINLVLLPIRYKQMTSMKQMTALQPKLKAIQERYKKLPKADPKKQDMNREIMALYQEHGVNPLGGCLPLLVQMPFLFAFYTMLASSIELRGAPFIWWIHDLSKADPYYITPIVMGVTMLAQQKMTPSVGDPAQRRMMMLMPIVFMFFFLSLSSGLVIYFLFSNLFGMAFQWGMQKMGEEATSPVRSGKKGGKRKKLEG